ncbi:Hint domain-containing protein [Roseomonas sp. HJA6]|uniref:Hint domain-containing protein n=1 Tax=Roseomonas alba TaxID=2846776 RepID=A0ABS7A587_9PROT|nr:Hint domain-containing protein [Neoroseomonas alba]MBW6397482.1 Hint domain-containing protein [Neoroseomonas alba]
MRGLIMKALRDLPHPRRMRSMPVEARTTPADAMPRSLPVRHQAVASLFAGTQVLTRGGEVPVESLDAGQFVMSLGVGAHWRPVMRVAPRHVDRATAPGLGAGALTEAPILIRADALMKGSPIRDIRVAPGQGIWLEGRVVPACLLVNGLTILRERRDGPVVYHDLYMEEPALLIADGTLIESGPGGEPGPDAAPLLLEGAALDAIHERLEQRARAMSGRA